VNLEEEGKGAYKGRGQGRGNGAVIKFIKFCIFLNVFNRERDPG
jgi:hypothetical protein